MFIFCCFKVKTLQMLYTRQAKTKLCLDWATNVMRNTDLNISKTCFLKDLFVKILRGHEEVQHTGKKVKFKQLSTKIKTQS